MNLIYQLFQINFLSDIEAKLFETNGGGLEYIYLIAFGDNPLDPGNILIVNALKLKLCLKSKVYPDDKQPEGKWVLRMFAGIFFCCYFPFRLWLITKGIIFKFTSEYKCRVNFPPKRNKSSVQKQATYQEFINDQSEEEEEHAGSSSRN